MPNPFTQLCIHPYNINSKSDSNSLIVAYRAPIQTLTHALYDLAAYPEYAESLREEVARVVERDGWTKTAIENMEKIGSFLKESMRLNAIVERK